MGDRAANLQQAIACYEQALRVHTPEAAPLDYAMTQNNLGNAYRQLPVGDRAANLQKAIACYEQALRFCTPEAAPFDYAVTQNNLGNAYAELPVGDRAANLQRPSPATSRPSASAPPRPPLRLRLTQQPGHAYASCGGGPGGQPAAGHRLLRAGPPRLHPRGRP